MERLKSFFEQIKRKLFITSSRSKNSQEQDLLNFTNVMLMYLETAEQNSPVSASDQDLMLNSDGSFNIMCYSVDKD